MSNEEKILAILEQHSKRFDQIDKRLDEQETKFNKRFDEQDAKFNKRFDEQDAKFNAQENNFSSKFNALENEIKTMKSSIINIEVQVTEKIPALFDAITVNNDKHEIYDSAIASLNAKTFNHNIRISALEDTIKPLLA